jgi:hypothetical protein
MSDESPIIPSETPLARRVIVTYKATLNVGNYSSFSAETMVIVDLPENTPPPRSYGNCGQNMGWFT